MCSFFVYVYAVLLLVLMSSKKQKISWRFQIVIFSEKKNYIIVSESSERERLDSHVMGNFVPRAIRVVTKQAVAAGVHVTGCCCY